MEQRTVSNVFLVAVAVIVCAAGPAPAGRLQAWGSDSDGQVSSVPAGDDYMAVAAGDAHGLALRSDGTVAAWGRNDDGQCNVPSGTYRSIAAGANFSLAIRMDGSLAAWGKDTDGVVSRVPAGNDFVAVEGGERFAVALRTDGSLIAWGNDRWGQVSGAPKGTDFIAVVAGDNHGVALRDDGSVVSWGYWAAIQGTPTSGSFTALGAGSMFCVALRSDGSLAWWGDDMDDIGLSKVPSGNDYIAVAAGYLHALTLKRDGVLVGWGAGTDDSGYVDWGQASPPPGKSYTALACGLYFSLALTDSAVTTNIADDFDDNQQSSLWTRLAADPANCWLDEVNGRLELRATTKTLETSAYYVSNGWQLDPTGNFSFKVDFHYGLVTVPTGWLTVGLTPDLSDLAAYHIEFGPSCDKYYPDLSYETVDGDRTQTDLSDRDSDNGTLYVSYNAATDTLYLSTVGYGADNAWRAVPGLLQASWSGRPLRLYLGGGSNGQEIQSGDAYLDNFVLETGSPAAPSLSPVYRFWSPVLDQHFYTIDPAERDRLIREYARVWTYEGEVFQAATAPDATGLAPVYRFWSLKEQGHFYTIDPAEKNKLVDKYAQIWRFEGVAFYAYPPGAQPPTSKPVYRFWRPRDNAHFYTIDPAERDRLVREYSKTFIFEGVAFYAFE